MTRHLHAVDPGGHLTIHDPRTTIRGPHDPPYDWQAHPDRPVLPVGVLMALDLLGQYVRVPGAVPRSMALDAVEQLARWARPDLCDTDPTPPHGTRRPL